MLFAPRRLENFSLAFSQIDAIVSGPYYQSDRIHGELSSVSLTSVIYSQYLTPDYKLLTIKPDRPSTLRNILARDRLLVAVTRLPIETSGMRPMLSISVERSLMPTLSSCVRPLRRNSRAAGKIQASFHDEFFWGI
jgi:hypothetical protein